MSNFNFNFMMLPSTTPSSRIFFWILHSSDSLYLWHQLILRTLSSGHIQNPSTSLPLSCKNSDPIAITSCLDYSKAHLTVHSASVFVPLCFMKKIGVRITQFNSEQVPPLLKILQCLPISPRVKSQTCCHSEELPHFSSPYSLFSGHEPPQSAQILQRHPNVIITYCKIFVW